MKLVSYLKIDCYDVANYFIPFFESLYKFLHNDEDNIVNNNDELHLLLYLQFSN